MAILRGHWQLFLLTAVVFALWNTPAVAPLKILVVFLHEAAHAIMVILTGGEVVSLTVHSNQGGSVWARGGSRFWTLTAGYLGSLLIGVVLLIAATRTKADRYVMGFCGVLMLLIAALYIRSGFALSFTIAVLVGMLVMARYFGHAVNDLALRIIGLSSIIYVPYDIFSDTIARSHLRSDARMLAEEFGGTTVMWGGLWLVISLVVIVGCLWRGLGPNSNLSLR
ncbi:MAG: M50 family metallopeptidase [Pseudomonadota bacterium]